jgi:transposase
MVLYGKYGNHLPLTRQSEGFAREGIDLDVSTLADWVGASAAALSPLSSGGARAFNRSTTSSSRLRITTCAIVRSSRMKAG